MANHLHPSLLPSVPERGGDSSKGSFVCTLSSALSGLRATTPAFPSGPSWAIALATIVWVISAACGGAEEPAGPKRVGISPSAPPEAPASLVTRAAEADGVTIPIPSVIAPRAQGTPVVVENQDPGGSGEYRFVPSNFTFAVGQTVTFHITAETELHTFTVPALGIDEAVDKSSETLFTHTFDRPGAFRLVCILHLASGMEGSITVR